MLELASVYWGIIAGLSPPPLGVGPSRTHPGEVWGWNLKLKPSPFISLPIRSNTVKFDWNSWFKRINYRASIPRGQHCTLNQCRFGYLPYGLDQDVSLPIKCVLSFAWIWDPRLLTNQSRQTSWWFGVYKLISFYDVDVNGCLICDGILHHESRWVGHGTQEGWSPTERNDLTSCKIRTLDFGYVLQNKHMYINIVSTECFVGNVFLV